jgi:hypothetical protein
MLHSLVGDPENGGDTFLQNVGNHLQECMV